MRLDVFEFETVEAPEAASAAGVEAAAGEPAEAGAAAEATSPVEGEAAAAPAPAASEPQFNPDEMAAELEYLRSLVQQGYGQQPQYQQQPDGQGNQPPEYDPFDPESVKAYMDWQRQQTIDTMRELLSPLSQTFEQQQAQAAAAESAALLADAVADEVSRNGEFSSNAETDAWARDAVVGLARQKFGDLQQRFGPTDRTAQIALDQASNEIRAMLKQHADAEYEKRTNQLATLAGAKSEPGIGPAGVTGTVEGAILSPAELARKYSVAR